MDLQEIFTWLYVAGMAAGVLLFWAWSRDPRGVPQYEYLIAMFIPRLVGTGLHGNGSRPGPGRGCRPDDLLCALHRLGRDDAAHFARSRPDRDVLCPERQAPGFSVGGFSRRGHRHDSLRLGRGPVRQTRSAPHLVRARLRGTRRRAVGHLGAAARHCRRPRRTLGENLQPARPLPDRAVVRLPDGCGCWGRPVWASSTRRRTHCFSSCCPFSQKSFLSIIDLASLRGLEKTAEHRAMASV